MIVQDLELQRCLARKEAIPYVDPIVGLSLRRSQGGAPTKDPAAGLYLGPTGER
jgi:hypothetical protein